jgi:hypothetical protein
VLASHEPVAGPDELMNPVGHRPPSVEVPRARGAVVDDDVEPVDRPEDISEVGLSGARDVEIIDP